MPFFKDLRRRSKASGKTDKSSQDSSTDGTNGTISKNKSTSTLNSMYGNPQMQMSSPNLSTFRSNGTNGVPPVPQRPNVRTSPSNRYSVSGLGTPSINGSYKPAMPSSPYAPRIMNISENNWVHQKVLLIYGQIGEPSQQPMDGNLVVSHHQDNFPAVNWPVCDSHFKALVHLTPGPNRLRFDFSSPKLASPGSSTPHSSWLNINYLPLVSNPPLQLAILVAKDSPLTYDAIPERIQREGNGLSTAIRKYRMAAYLWQAFTSEQMNRNRFGRRVFRYEEDWQTGSLTSRDIDTGQMRNEARIHVIRVDKTVAEIRDLDIAQQYEKATRKGDLYSMAMDAVREYFKPIPGQKIYVSALFLDAHWDTQAKTITGHAALGGGSGEIQLAIFGSQALQSYPSCIEEVVPAFSDTTRTDTTYVANDCNESGSNWEAANIGIGAHLHETGHLLGCPHQESGVMLRDYVTLNRTFTCREPASTRTNSSGVRLCLQSDECNWHRLDCLRFRFHPCFRMPNDPPLPPDDSVAVWTVDNGNVMVTAASGIAWIELFTEGDEFCHSSIEYLDSNGSSNGITPRQIMLNEGELRSRLPDDKRNKKMKVVIHSVGQGEHTIEDFGQLKSKASTLKLPNGQMGFRGSKLGYSQMEGSQPVEVIIESALSQTKLLKQIKVYHGFALDGVEFIYEDFTSQMFGNKGGKPGGSEFNFDTRRGECLLGFYLRAGLWIDGIEILTSLGRRSGVFGNPAGGSGHTLIPPRGYTIAGVSGSCGAWVDGFSLIITR